jgi:hypothetical protein
MQQCAIHQYVAQTDLIIGTSKKYAAQRHAKLRNIR